jgi:hypothetical protein
VAVVLVVQGQRQAPPMGPHRVGLLHRDEAEGSMTNLVPRGRAQIVRLADNRVAVSGSLAEIGAFLQRARSSGVLAGSSDPAPTAEPGVYLVTARLVPRVRETAPVVAWYQRPRVLALVVAGVLAALGAVGWLLVQLLIDALPVVLAVLAVGWLLAYLAGGTPVCTGLHCSGCRRH